MSSHDNQRPFALVQISDTHLFADPATLYRGWNTDAALDAVLAHLANDSEQVDALLLTGDLAEDESAQAYQRLAKKLGGWDVPCYALPGNHDDPQLMQAQLGMQVLGEAQLGGWDLLMLNSHQPGQVNGLLPASELERAREWLARGRRPGLLAVHHPPLSIASPWMDSIGLDNGAALMSLATEHGRLRGLLFGHAHQEVDMQQNGLRILGCPSSWRQFMPGASKPQEDEAQTAGYRRLWLHPDGQLETEIYRLPQSQGKI